jgi:amino acid transporter
MVPFEIIDVEAPFATAFLVYDDWPMYLVVSFVAASICASNVLSGSIGPPRILYTMAKDGLVHDWLSKISPTTSVPVRAVVVCGIVNIIGAAFFDFESLAKITSCFTLLIYTAVCAGVLFLRRRVEIGNFGLLHASVLAYVIASAWFQFSVISEGQFCWTSGVVNLIMFIFTCVLYITEKRTKKHKESISYNNVPIISDGVTFQKVFECPMVPFIPLLAVWINTFMIASMGIGTLISSLSVVVASALYYIIHSHRL